MPRLPARRRARVPLVVLVVAGLVTPACSDHHEASPVPSTTSWPDGDAFAPQSGATSGSPVKEGSFITFGTVTLRNVTGDPVTLVSAAPAWSEHVLVSAFGISPYGPTVPISELGVHAVDAVDIPGFVVPPSSGELDALYGITFEARLPPQEDDGIVIGVDVRYRVGDGKVETQRFPVTDLVCRWVGEAGHPCSTSYDGLEILDTPPRELLEQLLAKRSAASP